MSTPSEFSVSCPLPLADHPTIQMAHGGGGELMHRLIRDLFCEAFGGGDGHDGAILEPGEGRLAFTTDSYVVQPLFFRGGDIGDLAINGTVNDLAMCGARPGWLSAGFILEEGFSMEALWRIARSMRAAADRAGVKIVTGDTKVVDRGKGDGVFINTAGVGVVDRGIRIHPDQVKAGDLLVVSGDVGRHGIAIMAEREGLEFEVSIESDCAPVVEPVLDLLREGVGVHCLRDLTRGGLATVLAELAESTGFELQVEQASVPVSDGVQGACEILGLDPLYVANEGRFLAVIEEGNRDRAIDVLSRHVVCEGAVCVGRVGEERTGRALLRSTLGTARILDRLRGEQLPRIC